MTRASSRLRAVEKATEVFRRKGYEGASLSDLSEATGLGRSSLYHYFPGGKDDMARSALALVSLWIDTLEVEVLALPTRAERLDRFADGLDALYDRGTMPCLLGALSVGTADSLTADLAQTLGRSMDLLTRILTDAGIAEGQARIVAEDSTARVQGALILARGLNDPAPFTRALDAVRGLRS